MEEILAMLKDNGGIIATGIALLNIFIEISPIKINPLSSLLKWLGDCFNKDTKTQLEAISSKLNNVSDRIDKIEINDIRSSILNFSNSCMERKHTKEEFEHIIDLHSQYENMIEEKGMENGRVDLAFKYISELYGKCLIENSFLDGITFKH